VKSVKKPSDKRLAAAQLGRRSEQVVCEYLERQGFELIQKNARVGRFELDLIMKRAHMIVVCEVRSRSSTTFGHPAETIDTQKKSRLRAATLEWLSQSEVPWRELRFDVATVVWQPSFTIDYYENAF